MVFHFAQAKQKQENYRDQGRLIFLAPHHRTPFHWIALFFTGRVCEVLIGGAGQLVSHFSNSDFCYMLWMLYSQKSMFDISISGQHCKILVSFIAILFVSPISLSKLNTETLSKGCTYMYIQYLLNSQKRLRYKENTAKFLSLSWKLQNHVRILIYLMWPILYYTVHL